MFFSLLISSSFSSTNGSSVLFVFSSSVELDAQYPIFLIKSLNPKDAEITPIEPIIELELA